MNNNITRIERNISIDGACYSLDSSDKVMTMDKDQLIDFLKASFKEEKITNLDELTNFLKSGLRFKSLDADKALAQFYGKDLQDRAFLQASSSEAFGNYFAGKYGSWQQEIFVVVSLNHNFQLLSEDIISMGTSNKAPVSLREVFKKLILNNASNFMVVHNHPSGKLQPSAADLRVTEAVLSLAELSNIPLCDHFIVGSGNYYSLAENGDVDFCNER